MKIIYLPVIAGSALLLTASINLAHAQSAIPHEKVGPFADDTLEGWEERSFVGNTDYQLVDDNGTQVLQGHTQKQASILYREQTIDVTKTPVVSWSWKIDRTFGDINELTKAGDDFPARLYVVVRTGFLPWESLAINYVWSSNQPIDQVWTNPFTDKAKMIAVQTGDEQVGQWVRQSRNVAQDFKDLYDLDVTEIDGFAVMVDGDNSGSEAVSLFGQISFQPVAP